MDDKYQIVKDEMSSHLRIKSVKGGALPSELSGKFTKQALAEEAIRAYKVKRDRYKPESTPLIELDKLSKKDVLLEFAEKVVKVEVPEDLKNPAQIKKYLKECLEKSSD